MTQRSSAPISEFGNTLLTSGMVQRSNNKVWQSINQQSNEWDIGEAISNTPGMPYVPREQ